jgi:type I restriction enzyme, S subunit
VRTETVSLADVADLIRGVSYPKTDARDEETPGFVPVLRATNIQDSRLVLDTDLVHIAEHNVSDAQRLRPGDIVVATSSGSKHLVGKSALLRSEWRGSFGAFCAGIRPKPNVEPRYLASFLQSPSYWKQVGIKALGVNINNLRRGDLESLTLPLPEIDDQRRIVAEIEKQFSRLDEAVAGLQRVKANLKRYKAAVLKSAVTGRLVPTEADLARREGRNYETGAQLLQRILDTRSRQWQSKGKYKEPAAPDTADLPELPEGWVWASPEQLSAGEPHSLAIGPFGSSLKVSDYTMDGVPLVFVRNIRSGSFGGPNTIFVSPGKAAELKAHWVAAGDLLVTKMGDPPGDVCVYPSNCPTAVITADCIKIRVASSVLSVQFFAYAIESDVVHRQVLGITKGVAQLKVSLGRFGCIGFPLPPLPEQHRIVAEVDRLLSIAREAEAEVDANLKRAQGLRQAVLARAFQPAVA